MPREYEILSIGSLDLPDDHPDTYTGNVTCLHEKMTEFGDIELYAETKLGQPVPLCTIDCANLLDLILEAQCGEVVTKSDMPHGCEDYADVLSVHQEAMRLLKKFSVRGSMEDKHAACNFLKAHTPQ